LNHPADINEQTNDFKYNNEPFASCLDLEGNFIVNNTSTAVFVLAKCVQ